MLSVTPLGVTARAGAESWRAASGPSPRPTHGCGQGVGACARTRNSASRKLRPWLAAPRSWRGSDCGPGFLSAVGSGLRSLSPAIFDASNRDAPGGNPSQTWHLSDLQTSM